MRAHVIENNAIINTIVVDSLDIIPDLVDAEIGGAIGWTWNDGNPTPPPAPPVPVPTEVTMVQAQQELLAAGLLDAVEEFIATLPRADQIDWRYRQMVRRDWPLVEVVRLALGWTSEQVDALFSGADTR